MKKESAYSSVGLNPNYLIHDLKTIPTYFQAAWSGVKRFEMRKNDRLYKCGDMVKLREYNLSDGSYSGREVHCRITYILRNYGELKDYVIFSFDMVELIGSV